MNSLIDADKDPMGRAIMDYFSKGKASRLRVFSSLFYEDEIPVATLFRSFDEMPPLEQEASRVITSQGTVVKYMLDGSTQVKEYIKLLFPAAK